MFQTVGLPFLFIPITAASYAGLPADKTSEASSLINVSRNLGGSIGVSVAGTMLAEATQRHQAYLTDHLVPSSPAYQTTVQHITALLSGQGVAHPPLSQVLGVIGQILNQQATILAYIDVFRGYALLAAVLAPIAFLLLRPAKGPPALGH